MSAHGMASGTMGLDAVAPLPRPHPLLVTPRRVLRMRSDAALVERFRAGDQEAFTVLYERHRATVLAVCIGVLGSRHDAEDAAQDSFASLAMALRTSPPRDLRAWLARVARNAAIDVIRRRRAVTSSEEALESPAPAHAEVRADWELMLAGLRELPESQRTALLMRELGGHSYQEIGNLLELDEASVRGLIARGRIGLRAHREATEMPCAAAREALATEPDGRQRDKTVRRHLRTCSSCKAYGRGLRRDASALRSVVPAPLGGVAGGSAIFGGFAAKTLLTGGVLTQVTTACAVSVCAVGGIALLYPHALGHHEVRHATRAVAIARSHSAADRLTPNGSPLSPRALRTAAPVRGSTATRRSPISAGPARLASRVERAPARATAVVSTASIVLTRRFQLPGSQNTGTTTGAPATGGAAPTNAAPSLPHPVWPTPARPPTASSSSSYGWPPTVTPRTGSGSYPEGGYGASGSGRGTATGSGTGTGTSSGTGTGTGTSTGTGTGSGTAPAGDTGTYPAPGIGGSSSRGTDPPSAASPAAPVGFW